MKRKTLQLLRLLPVNVLLAGTAAAEYVANGHQIAPRDGNPGVFCRKCGLYVARLKHVKLQITGKVCRQATLPADKWLKLEVLIRSEASPFRP